MKPSQHPVSRESITISHEAWKATAQGVSFLSGQDSLLEVDYLDTFRRKSYLEPEKELMLAVLEQAIDYFQTNILKKTRKQENLFQEAEAWIIDDNDHWLFSFDIICETLDISPSFLRSRLLDWKRAQLIQLQSLKN